MISFGNGIGKISKWDQGRNTLTEMFVSNAMANKWIKCLKIPRDKSYDAGLVYGEMRENLKRDAEARSQVAFD